MNLKLKAVKKKKKQTNKLGISVDTPLFFEHHIASLYKKARQKLHALARIAHYMEFDKRRSLRKDLYISI